MPEEIQPIKSLDELRLGDVVEVKGVIHSGLYVVEAIGDVPEHEREVLLHPIHCPETPHSEIDYHRTVLKDPILEFARLELLKKDKKIYSGWKYVGIKMVD